METCSMISRVSLFLHELSPQFAIDEPPIDIYNVYNSWEPFPTSSNKIWMQQQLTHCFTSL
jgi:hypothetical protein